MSISNFNKFIDQENLNNTEGSRGFSNLCKIAAALGYKDPLYQGSLSKGGKSGDLMNFLEDNPGAIKAIYDWIEKQHNKEWEEELAYHLNDAIPPTEVITKRDYRCRHGVSPLNQCNKCD